MPDGEHYTQEMPGTQIIQIFASRTGEPVEVTFDGMAKTREYISKKFDNISFLDGSEIL